MSAQSRIHKFRGAFFSDPEKMGVKINYGNHELWVIYAFLKATCSIAGRVNYNIRHFKKTGHPSPIHVWYLSENNWKITLVTLIINNVQHTYRFNLWNIRLEWNRGTNTQGLLNPLNKIISYQMFCILFFLPNARRIVVIDFSQLTCKLL